MGKIENSPLIEAIFELRWGVDEQGGFKYSRDEADFFPGMFFHSLKEIGFGHSELLNNEPGRPNLPFEPKHRFRKADNEWPCFQIGLGLFTANQLGNLSAESSEKDKYDWDTFKPVIVDGLKALDKAHPSNIKGLVNPRVSLRYQDGFILDDTIESFVSNRIKAEIKIANVFTEQPNISESARDINLNFVYETDRPKGTITISVVSAKIGGKAGIVIDTVVSSKWEGGFLSVKELSTWCEEAHDLQRHSFATLISGSDL